MWMGLLRDEGEGTFHEEETLVVDLLLIEEWRVNRDEKLESDAMASSPLLASEDSGSGHCGRKPASVSVCGVDCGEAAAV